MAPAARLSAGSRQSRRRGGSSGPASANQKRHKHLGPRRLPRAAQSEQTQTAATPQPPTHGPAVRSERTGQAGFLAKAAGQSSGTQTAAATPPRSPQANRGGRKQAAARPLVEGGVPAGRHASPAMEVPAAGPPGREAAGRRRDERSLEALSLAAGGGGAAAAAGRQQPEGRRATLASALELEGTVLREGRLTQFVANNLERRIRLSGAPRAEPPAGGGGGSSIPAIDPGALQDVVALAGQVAAQVDELLRAVHGGLQALTALSVGCIQTYRDGVESLGEAADLSIRAMYALVARCEELDRAMQPVPALARRIRDMKGTLERLEGLCK
ncbi:BLOC-1-related complex subunit 6 [Opisthocomus hoazin]|uniref:BLOC-1-related complex subunit 6 n=1 Tax=Opisthocomus hoazin TaxID=30419 RepID=UPI003F5319A1